MTITEKQFQQYKTKFKWLIERGAAEPSAIYDKILRETQGMPMLERRKRVDNWREEYEIYLSVTAQSLVKNDYEAFKFIRYMFNPRLSKMMKVQRANCGIIPTVAFSNIVRSAPIMNWLSEQGYRYLSSELDKMQKQVMSA